MELSQKHLMIGGGLVVAAAAIYVWARGARGVAEDATRGAVNVATGAAEGVIHGVSDAVGMPTPEQSKCEKAKADGNTWDASFYCPAGEFVGYLFE